MELSLHDMALLIPGLAFGFLLRFISERNRSHLDERRMGIEDKEDMIRYLNEQLEETRLVYEARVLASTEELSRLKTQQFEPPIASWQKDMYGRYVLVNDTAMRTIFGSLGLTRKDVLGRQDEEIWSAETAAAIRELARRALLSRDKRSRVMELSLHKDLPQFTVYKYVMGIPGSAEPICYVAYLIESFGG